MSQDRKVFVVGNGMTKFIRPGRDDNPDYPDMAKQATLRALRDAGIQYDKVQSAAIGYIYGDSAYGQRALYEVGMTGIPMYNVHNNCATGSTALYLCYNLIKGGIYDCTLALGFDKMEKGSLVTKYADRTSAMDKIFLQTAEIQGLQDPKIPFAPQIFGNAGLEHQKKYGTKDEHFAKVAWKNHKHSANNPYAQFRDVYTLEQIIKSPKIYGPLTKLQCCPTSDGAAAAVIVSEKFVKEHNLYDQAVEIVDMQVTTDPKETYEKKSLISMAGFDMAALAAKRLYEKTGVTPAQVAVCELHDCFSANELVTYEALQLCPIGKAGEYIDKGAFTYGGQVVVNPSGGLISKGHPLGATGLAQCAELCWQVRNMAGPRQVNDAHNKYALQHNLGLGGACVVALYKRYNPKAQGFSRPEQSADPVVLEKYEQQNPQVNKGFKSISEIVPKL